MRYIIATLILLITPTVGASFFEKNIVGTEIAQDRIEQIKIENFTFQNTITATKYAQTKFFIARTKAEILDRYEDGRVNDYELADIANNLEYVTHSMNEYFKNMKAFERSKNRTYRTLALQNLRDANSRHGDLRAVTQKSTRQE